MRTLQPARSQVNMIETRKREHSRKPDEQYMLIEECSPGPYLELFARHPLPGWIAWGDEADEEIAPRGQVHPGYRGGPIQLPILASHARLDESTSEAVSSELRRRYESGRSIRDLAIETEYSISRVRALLSKADTRLRDRGAPALQLRHSLTSERESYDVHGD
ncbi:MAG: MT-A70 family methyltransferase [Thermomicrobiales bacterium]